MTHTILDATRFTGMLWSVGVVVVKVNHKTAKGYIGVSMGKSEELDSKDIAMYWSKLPPEVLNHLFPDVLARGYDFIS